MLLLYHIFIILSSYRLYLKYITAVFAVHKARHSEQSLSDLSRMGGVYVVYSDQDYLIYPIGVTIPPCAEIAKITRSPKIKMMMIKAPAIVASLFSMI